MTSELPFDFYGFASSSFAYVRESMPLGYIILGFFFGFIALLIFSSVLLIGVKALVRRF